MALKITTWITLVAFVLLNYSCAIRRTRMEHPSLVAGHRARGAVILGVFMKDGETVEFRKGHPGVVQADTIMGEVERPVEEVPLALSDVVKTELGEHARLRFLWTAEGKKYEVYKILAQTPDSLSFISVTWEVRKIPLSEVGAVNVLRSDEGRTFRSVLTVVGVVALVGGALFAIALATKESCPFVYSFDGEQYQFDAEPYGGATCEGLKRTEWCRLEHATEIDGAYRLRLTNEVDETQYTDELTLVVVDHPEGIRVVPDIEGSFVAFPQIIPPLTAFDATGRDIMRHVGVDDWIFWESELAQCDDADRPLRQELTFQFPKPSDARTVKLLFNGCNTLWGSQMVKRLLELHGDQITQWYEQIGHGSMVRDALFAWGLREECFRLHARAKTATGWESRALLLGGGPFASEDKAYTLDISDVPGDTLTLRLTPPPLFWMINFIGVDYSEGGVPVRVAELRARDAVDQNGRDVADLLAATDGRYLSMPDIGEYAHLVFDAPEREPDLIRSVFVKASGYYDIHLDAQGPPKLELLARIAGEPGYVARYALEQYSEWREDILASR